MGLTTVTYNVCDEMDVLITLNIDPTLSQTVTLISGNEKYKYYFSLL